MIELTLYHKTGCHLCENVEDAIDPWLADGRCQMRRVNILDDPALFEEYRYRIPVLVRHDNRRSLEGRISLADIATLLVD